MSLINNYGSSSGQVIEVGCAHGVLLSLLKTKGYDCVGVEPDEATSNWTQKNTGIDVVTGFFPEDKLPQCDIFLAFDVLEQSPHTDAFMVGTAKLLNPGGIIIIQTPINRYPTLPPFGNRFQDAFDDIEHLYLFTDQSMIQLADLAHLRILGMTQRLWLHHEICIFSKK